MARWQPDAHKRLALAALDLFAEHGYENTTVIEIAERAGLTKSTFFRHFPDKREVLSGGDTMPRLLAEGIAAAPAQAGPARSDRPCARRRRTEGVRPRRARLRRSPARGDRRQRRNYGSARR